MGFLEAVEVYFRGERNTGLALIPFGVVMLGLGIYFWRFYGGGLGKGIGIPFVVVALLAGAGGGMLYRTVVARKARLAAAFEQTPDVPVSAENARMKKVNANWRILKTTWAALSILGFGLLLFVKRDWVSGIALALICLCAVAAVVDTFAERRAHIYAERIAP